MNILGFDTCLDKMYVSLSNGEKILSSKIIETTKEHYHSAFLISTIKNILKENDLSPNDIEVIVTNIGPGSFTGIRACTTVARVFAQSLKDNIKTIGVSSLEILSRLDKKEKNAQKTDHSQSTLVALDARKDMAYVAIYEDKKQVLVPQTVLIDDLKEMINAGKQFVITDDKLLPILGGISYQKTDNDFGEILIELALEKIEAGCDTDWKSLHPLYIQPPPINIKKQN